MLYYECDMEKLIVDFNRNRKDGAIVAPMGVVINGKDEYGLDRLGEIDQFFKSGMKVCFCCVHSIFDKHSIADKRNLIYFDNVKIRDLYDEDTGCLKQYILFMSNGIDMDGEIFDQINYYVDMLSEYISGVCEKKRKERIENEMKSQMIDT